MSALRVRLDEQTLADLNRVADLVLQLHLVEEVR